MDMFQSRSHMNSVGPVNNCDAFTPCFLWTFQFGLNQKQQLWKLVQTMVRMNEPKVGLWSQSWSNWIMLWFVCSVKAYTVMKCNVREMQRNPNVGSDCDPDIFVWKMPKHRYQRSGLIMDQTSVHGPQKRGQLDKFSSHNTFYFFAGAQHSTGITSVILGRPEHVQTVGLME